MKRNLKFLLARFYLPILSGIFIGTSYIPFPPWALIFCLLPLWLYFFNQDNLKSIFWGGWITQFVLTLIGFHWVAHTAKEFGHFPWAVSTLILLLFAGVAHLHYALHGIIWFQLVKKLQLKRGPATLLLPFIFWGVEEFWPFIFPWHLGYPLLWAKLPAYHLAEWVGFKGLNLVVLCLNGLALYVWMTWGKSQVRPRHLVVLALSILLPNALGWMWAQKEPPPSKSLNVLVVQANIGNMEKVQAHQGQHGVLTHIYEKYRDITTDGLISHPEAELIVWPETAYPDFMNLRQSSLNWSLFEQIEVWDRTLLAGSYLRMGSPPQTFNSIVLAPPGEYPPSEYYNKTHLLAFGEYFPGASIFPILKSWFPFVADFGRGDGPEILNWGELRVGPQICYEGLFHEFSARLAQKGAQILVNVTNDSWFGYPSEPHQHLIMTAARAVETQRPLIRSTNTGLSTVVKRDGSLQEIGPHEEEWYGFYVVDYPTEPKVTLHSRIAPYWPWFVLLICFTVGSLAYVQTRKHGLGPYPK